MKYRFELTGITPLLLHADDVERADELDAWRKAPENKNLSKPGDDRSPDWTWQTYLYTDGDVLTMPADNLMVSLRQAGAELKIKGNKTLKSETQSGMLITEVAIPLLVGGSSDTVQIESLLAACGGDFASQAKAVQNFGFRLFVKRAKVGQSKHVRVRPRFDKWAIVGSIDVTAKEITEPVLSQLFSIAGDKKGLGDWRPSAPKAPGPFGRFTAKVTKISE